MNMIISKYPDEVRKILANYPEDRKQSAIMPLLHLVQAHDGYITKPVMEAIGEIAGVSVTDVASIAGFYTLFSNEPGGKYRVQVCTDLPCALRGADDFLAKLCENVGIKVGEISPDGAFTIEAVTCLAGCHHAPMFQVQGDGDIIYHEDQTVESALKVLDDLRAKTASSKEGA